MVNDLPPLVTWDGRLCGETYVGPTPHFRAGTDANGTRDRDVWQSIFVENEYELGDLHANDVVVDVGMHIGAFSCLAFAKGSRRVYGFEPDRSSYEMACANAREFGRGIWAHQYAVTRSDRGSEVLFYEPGSMAVNSTGGTQVGGVSLDGIVREHGPVRLLKMDCESYEWPILYTATKLDAVMEIVGEFHEVGHERVGWPEEQCRMESLAPFLRSRGFAVTYAYGVFPLGHFRAVR